MPDENTKTDCFLDRWDTRAAIAMSLTISMIALTFLLAIRAPESDPFKILLGAMLTVGFASAIGWYFNSSMGSEKKDVVQAKVAEKLAENVAHVMGTGSGDPAKAESAAIAAAAAAAPAAAAVAAPAAAAVAAPPAAAIAAPPVVAKEVPPAVAAEVAKAMAASKEVEKQS